MAIQVRYTLVKTPGPGTDPPAPETPGYGADAYARMLAALLPRGLVWRLEPDSTLSKVLRALAGELARIDARARDLLREWDPRTTEECIEDWERTVGIGEPSEALEERRVAVVQRLLSRGGQSRAFFLELLAALGYPEATIQEFGGRELRCPFRAGDRLSGPAAAHTWQVTLPHDGPVWEHLDVEAIVRAAAPAHTTVLFAYV